MQIKKPREKAVAFCFFLVPAITFALTLDRSTGAEFARICGDIPSDLSACRIECAGCLDELAPSNVRYLYFYEHQADAPPLDVAGLTSFVPTLCGFPAFGEADFDCPSRLLAVLSDPGFQGATFSDAHFGMATNVGSCLVTQSVLRETNYTVVETQSGRTAVDVSYASAAEYAGNSLIVTTLLASCRTVLSSEQLLTGMTSSLYDADFQARDLAQASQEEALRVRDAVLEQIAEVQDALPLTPALLTALMALIDEYLVFTDGIISKEDLCYACTRYTRETDFAYTVRIIATAYPFASLCFLLVHELEIHRLMAASKKHLHRRGDRSATPAAALTTVGDRGSDVSEAAGSEQGDGD